MLTKTITHFTGADGVQLCADVFGAEGDPVVFLHGGGQTRGSWGAAAEIVARSGRRAICLDLRGHGDSGRSRDGVYSLDVLIRDLLNVVDQIDGSPAIVGASIGGMTALAAVGESDVPVATALILVDVTPRLNPDGAKRVKDFMEASPDGFATIEEAAAAVARYLPHRPRKSSPDGLRRNLRQSPGDGRFYWHWDPRFLAGDLTMREAIQSRLEVAAAGVSVPTLLVRGALSEIVDEESVRHFLELVPHAESQDVGGAAHMVAGDMNDAFTSAVIAFLERSRGIG